MSTRKTLGPISATAAILGAGIATAAPAAAGGVGDFLSPAFGTVCTNHHGTHTHGSTTHGTGAGNGNLAGLPIGSPASQCGGADLPAVTGNLSGPPTNDPIPLLISTTSADSIVDPTIRPIRAFL